MENPTISVKEVQDLLNKKNPVFILDVRPQDQRNEWYIPESFHKDVYTQLNSGDLTVLDDIKVPGNTPVVTVCAAGKTSLIASEILRSKGITAYSLEGGMKAWNYAWNIAEYKLPNSDLYIIQVRRAAKGCLSYVIGSGNEAIVVDASLKPEVYLDIARQKGWRIRYVMDTHIHADYLSRTRELSKESGAEHLFIDQAKVDYPFVTIKDEQILRFGNAEVQVVHTPGHTRESTSYLISNKLLLTGDTLFTDGVGRPDLKADKAEAIRKASQLFDSLNRIKKLSDDTMILPAHISQAVRFDGEMIRARLVQLKQNLELLNLPRQQFIEASLKRIPPTPANYLSIAELNKKGSFDGHNPADLEAGANRCAVA